MYSVCHMFAVAISQISIVAARFKWNESNAYTFDLIIIGIIRLSCNAGEAAVPFDCCCADCPNRIAALIANRTVFLSLNRLFQLTAVSFYIGSRVILFVTLQKVIYRDWCKHNNILRSAYLKNQPIKHLIILHHTIVRHAQNIFRKIHT